MNAGASIREIAKQTGLSVATVSLALREKGRISKATKERVRATAERLGYRPHPLFSRAFSEARKPEAQRYRETIAFICEWKTEKGPEHQQMIHAGASERATSMGYLLEEFPVSGQAQDQRRLSRMLTARGIRGLIFIPRLLSTHPRVRIEWENFACVEIGRTIWHPRNFHRVETSDFSKISEALHLLKKVGYKRIGMAVEPMQNRQHAGVYYAAMLLAQNRQPARNRVPVFAANTPWNEKNFSKWVRRHQPDVLFIHAEVGPRILEWLLHLGLQVPADISLFCANVRGGHWSGMQRDYVAMGRYAVERVSLLLEREELNLPSHPTSWQVDEIWRPGKTLSHPIASHIPREGETQEPILPKGHRIEGAGQYVV